jgi:hypothetical protein
LTDAGRVIVTTPGTWCDVGHVLYLIGDSATYGIAPADWVLRLVACRPMNGGKPWGEGVEVRPATDALITALANRNIHKSLIAEPHAPE